MQGTRALVTGAGQRVGKAIAINLAKRGLAVAIHYRSSSDGAQDTKARIEELGGKAELVQGDLSNVSDIKALLPGAARSLGGAIDVLINNASLFDDDTVTDFEADQFHKHMSVNLLAPMLLAQSMESSLPIDEKGLVINLVDQRVWKLTPKFFTYTLSKSALWTATQTMAQGLAPRIRVNGIGPGPTLRNVRQDTEDFEKQVKATLTREGASPDEICKAVLYLLDADAVTGQMIAVDGGQHLIWQTPDVDGVVE